MPTLITEMTQEGRQMAKKLTPRERVAGEIVDMYSVKFEVQENGVLKQLPPVDPQPVSGLTDTEKLAVIDSIRSDLDAWKAKQKTAIQWRHRSELWGFERVNYFNQRMGIRNLFPFQFCDINGNALQRAQKPRSAFSTGKVDKHPQEYRMQQNRQYTGKMRKAAHRDWLAKQSGKKVLEIVSHIETPLTGDTRRIA